MNEMGKICRGNDLAIRIKTFVSDMLIVKSLRHWRYQTGVEHEWRTRNIKYQFEIVIFISTHDECVLINVCMERECMYGKGIEKKTNPRPSPLHPSHLEVGKEEEAIQETEEFAIQGVEGKP